VNTVAQFADVINLRIQSGRTIDAIKLDGWRIDVGYPEDRDRAEEQLDEPNSSEEEVDDEPDATIADN
jgi:glucose-1-phosphate thymidylyltransferase